MTQSAARRGVLTWPPNPPPPLTPRFLNRAQELLLLLVLVVVPLPPLPVDMQYTLARHFWNDRGGKLRRSTAAVNSGEQRRTAAVNSCGGQQRTMVGDNGSQQRLRMTVMMVVDDGIFAFVGRGG